MIKSFFSITLVCALSACSTQPKSTLTIDKNVMPLQHVVVIADSIDDSKATLYRYEKLYGRWQQVGASHAVVLGKNGLGKTKEGDGRSPSGKFPLLQVFGYQASAFNHLQMPYRAMTAQDVCVDDPQSTRYNQITGVPADNNKDWQSAENMRRDIHHRDDLYKWGIVVDYNSGNTEKPADPQKGSCIFMHLWRDANSGTAGCTAMSEANMLNLLGWLDRRKNPLLVQGTREQLQLLSLPFALPH